jgi:ABC-type dipeptide/oligopeptide/nickel transport system ATPase subunit
MADIIEIKGLKKYFTVSGGRQLKAIDDISFSIRKGETFGLVGESGCGKTTTGRVLVRLYNPSGGIVMVDGVDIFSLEGEKSKAFTRKVQMIFQDPYASLNPRRTVQDSIAEGWTSTGCTRVRNGSPASMNCWSWWAFPRNMPAASPTNSPADNASASASPARSSCGPSSSSATSPFQRWTCPSRHRSSTC